MLASTDYQASVRSGVKVVRPTYMDCNVEIDGLLVIRFYGSVDGRTAHFWRYRSCLHACVQELRHGFLRTFQALDDTTNAKIIGSVQRCLAGLG